jgi:uncharacterized protein YoxC
LSFFDEADEPPTTTRTAPRRRRVSGSGRRPPTEQQAIQVRRAVAAVALLIVLILIVLGVHSCQISQRNSSLKDYTNNVSSLVQQSDQLGSRFFSLISSGTSSNVSSLQSSIDEARVQAGNQLNRAHSLSVPDEMKAAQTNLVLALQMRYDAIGNVARKIQPALGTSTSKDAITSIAAQMARFYASDVVYKDYTTPHIASALHAAGIAIGGSNGETIESGQFLNDLGWVNPSFVATKLGAKVPTANGKPAPGLHGHSLDSVSVGSTTLQTGSTNAIPASPPATFTLHLTNSGQNNETNVVCKMQVSGTSVSGQTILPQTTAGQSTTCQVKLTSAPTAGTYTVNASVSPVPGERNSSNNTLSFPVTFQ